MSLVVTVTCPACWQPTAIELAAYEGRVEQFEDCQVCCRPMHIRASITPSLASEEGHGPPDVHVDVELDG